MRTHAHAHSHDHAHATADFGRAFAIGVTANLAYVGIQAVYGVLAHSVALLADAAHNLSDVLGLLLAWGASVMARRLPSQNFTYGLRKSSILAALGNAAFLLLATGAIAWEAVLRLFEPRSVEGATVMWVALAGVAVNGGTALLFMRGRKRDLNVRGAFLHLAADAVVSLGVVIAGLGIVYTGWLWLDPMTSLVISVVIVAGTWALLRDSIRMSLDAVPQGIDMAEVTAYLAQLPGVAAVHDLHVWAMSTTETALTVHLLMPGGYPGDGFHGKLGDELHHRFGIGHATTQVETDPGHPCTLAPTSVV
ncbi:MAG: cation transporter [Proteobacteria bacterium]|nr:cation transporter [Pseudomonadota bacterium]